MARPSYGVAASNALLQSSSLYSTVANQIPLPGIPANPPTIEQYLAQAGIENNALVRLISDKIRSGQELKDATKKAGERAPGTQFVMTCQKWLEAGDYIYFHVAPSQAQWSMNLRIAERKTLAGTVQHAWRNLRTVQRPSYFSEPVISFSFQSGNIIPIYSPGAKAQNDGGTTPQQNAAPPAPVISMPPGHVNFYRFLDLLNESRIVEGTDGSGRQSNIVYIMYHSRVFPSIVLAGMFQPESFSFSEDATNPNQINWNASFTVYDSFPRFDNSSALISTWHANRSYFPNSKDPVLAPVSDQEAQRARANSVVFDATIGSTNDVIGRVPNILGRTR